jgi:uncharacterized membrane protein YecN with MAPEG domain
VSITPPQPPDDLGRFAPQRRRVIASSLWFTVPGTLALIAAAYVLTPPPSGLATAAERLTFAVRWLFVAFLPYAAVCLVILYRRFAEGAHNPLLNGESERLKIHGRVMQNTLEQLVWLALCILPLATLLSSSQARVIPIACVFFVFARVVYWWGYLRNGTLGRAPGVQLTFTLNISLLVATLVRLAAGQAT